MFSQFFLPFLVTFLTTSVATAVCIPLFKKWKLVDDPATHKHPGIIHKTPIPRGGGIPIFIGITVAGLFFLPFSKIVFAIFLACLLAVIVGVLDDKYDISPYARFLLNIVVAVIVVGSGVGIPFVTSPFGGVLHLDAFKLTFDFLGHHSLFPLSDGIAVLWIVWVMNMLNWSKGVDGQMPGIVTISAIVIGLLSLRFYPLDQFSLLSATLSFITAGAALGFLLFNFYPAKIFPGYGATVLYLLLSVVSILSGAKLATAILVMGVPMADGVFTVIRRILTGHSPFWHDRKHLHHLLLHFGFTQRWVALFYWIVSAIVGAISLTLSSKEKLFAIIMLGILLGGGLLFLHILVEYRHEKNSI
ncbi:MAG TPA: MraY family glycosyltransferase [Candidatus Saccharimonadales bacterium]|nr:MraY family glycosyltransferase [Candidatus Saccharimonadales bacterium]